MIKKETEISFKIEIKIWFMGSCLSLSCLFLRRPYNNKYAGALSPYLDWEFCKILNFWKVVLQITIMSLSLHQIWTIIPMIHRFSALQWESGNHVKKYTPSKFVLLFSCLHGKGYAVTAVLKMHFNELRTLSIQNHFSNYVPFIFNGTCFT